MCTQKLERRKYCCVLNLLKHLFGLIRAEYTILCIYAEFYNIKHIKIMKEGIAGAPNEDIVQNHLT